MSLSKKNRLLCCIAACKEQRRFVSQELQSILPPCLFKGTQQKEFKHFFYLVSLFAKSNAALLCKQLHKSFSFLFIQRCTAGKENVACPFMISLKKKKKK